MTFIEHTCEVTQQSIISIKAAKLILLKVRMAKKMKTHQIMCVELIVDN